MNQVITKGVILSRTNFGEADRIITILTPDQGKLRLMAKGVRRSKSKLAGGIELFSVSDITFIRGRGDIGTLISARLSMHYGQIVKHIDRTMLGYELIKQINRLTEDETEEDYFTVLQQVFEALNEPLVPESLVRTWFLAQMLDLAGHSPNLLTNTSGRKLEATKRYLFSFEDMAFAEHERGNFDASRIKFLRLLFSSNPPTVLAQVEGAHTFTTDCMPLVQSMSRDYLRA